MRAMKKTLGWLGYTGGAKYPVIWSFYQATARVPIILSVYRYGDYTNYPVIGIIIHHCKDHPY